MSSPAFSKKDNYSRCMNSAIYSLAMREHSRQEIYNKLTYKGFAEGVNIDSLLDELEKNNYLNEHRFTKCFIRSRSQRGQGANKISNDLRQRGITSHLVNQAMSELNIDWYEIACEQREKKFGSAKPTDYKEKARQMRFLSSRGFDAEIIRSICNASA
ncbi:MAG TPA: regulatory protein RecX [Leucothrix sp.]|nr:regulatory protein RecX [Leucothrix sp.]